MLDKIELELTVTELVSRRGDDKITLMHVMQKEGDGCEKCGERATATSEFTFLAPSGMFIRGAICKVTIEPSEPSEPS
jgi:hypothetical protein